MTDATINPEALAIAGEINGMALRLIAQLSAAVGSLAVLVPPSEQAEEAAGLAANAAQTVTNLLNQTIEAMEVAGAADADLKAAREYVAHTEKLAGFATAFSELSGKRLRGDEKPN